MKSKDFKSRLFVLLLLTVGGAGVDDYAEAESGMLCWLLYLRLL